jgi:hypothetical protein
MQEPDFIVRNRHYRTVPEAGMSMPDWGSWLPGEMPMPDWFIIIIIIIIFYY